MWIINDSLILSILIDELVMQPSLLEIIFLLHGSIVSFIKADKEIMKRFINNFISS